MHDENMPLVVKRSQIVDVKAGNSVKIVEPVNLYGCVLGDSVEVGPFTEIQSEVVIGDRTKIQSHTFICSLVRVGNDCFIGHGVMFVNDLLRGGPARQDKSKWLATSIGDRVSIGSNSTLLPVQICDDVVIGAGSVVTRDILEPGTYAGNPAQKVKKREAID
jgi:acetyltransferase-like isoleucine patch superfamily enzyme